MYECAHEILTRETLLELVEKSQNGCIESKETIVNHNVRLVEKLIGPYIPFAEKEELIQEGIIGVCEAVDKFDFSKNVSFSTYATIRIKKRIVYFIKENRTIKIPHWVYDTKEIDNHKKRTEIQSLNKVFGDGMELTELIGNHDAEIEKMEKLDVIKRLFERLEIIEKYVIIGSFVQGESLSEIAIKLGISKERVRQIKCSALNKLKKRGIEDGIKFRRFN